MKRVLQERGLWIEGLKKQFGRQKKDKKRHFRERLVEEAMSEASISDRLGAGKGCWVRQILEAEQDFATEESPHETVILEVVHEVIFYPKFHCELNYVEYHWELLRSIAENTAGARFRNWRGLSLRRWIQLA